MMALMMGARNDTALDRAADLGLAFQLTNIARNVLDDAACGRIYLPTQWLHAHGIAVHAVAEPQHRDVLVQVAQQLLAHAQPYYASAYRGLRQLPVRSAWAVASALRIYCAIGTQVQALGAHAWAQRATSTRVQKLLHTAAGAGDALLTRGVGWKTWQSWREGSVPAMALDRQGLWTRPRWAA